MRGVISELGKSGKVVVFKLGLIFWSKTSNVLSENSILNESPTCDQLLDWNEACWVKLAALSTVPR